MARLGVNIDHVATVRQARREWFPSPVQLALQAVDGGADGITAHLREDRRHIQDEDLRQLKKNLSVPLNMEMALAPDVVDVACQVKPVWCCVVPEKRQELTTEGGLDLTSLSPVEDALKKLKDHGIKISLFIEPDEASVEMAKKLNADAVELHTGPYAQAFKVKKKSESEACSGTNLSLRTSVDYETSRLLKAATAAEKAGLLVNAGHGLDYENVSRVVQGYAFHEFNIGFAIVAYSLEVGMKKAVEEMKNKLRGAVCAES